MKIRKFEIRRTKGDMHRPSQIVRRSIEHPTHAATAPPPTEIREPQRATESHRAREPQRATERAREPEREPEREPQRELGERESHRESHRES